MLAAHSMPLHLHMVSRYSFEQPLVARQEKETKQKEVLWVVVAHLSPMQAVLHAGFVMLCDLV